MVASIRALALAVVCATGCQPAAPAENPNAPPHRALVEPDDSTPRGFCTGGLLVAGKASTYCLVFEAASWTRAIQGCAARGGHLAIIKDAYENDALVRGLSGRSPDLRAWVGLSDAEREGDWRWLDGEPPFANWRPGEPNDQNGEDCAEWILPGGGFNDLACTTPHAYLCESGAGPRVAR